MQVGVSALFNRNVGKGRLFSRPLWRFRFFAPWRMGDYILAARTRMMQLAILWPAGILIPVTLSFTLGVSPWAQAPYFIAVILIYSDDWITGDDDRWNGMKNRVKSAVRKLRVLRPATQ